MGRRRQTEKKTETLVFGALNYDRRVSLFSFKHFIFLFKRKWELLLFYVSLSVTFDADVWIFTPKKKRGVGKFFFFSRVRACSRGRTPSSSSSLVQVEQPRFSILFLLLTVYFFFFFLFNWGREGIEGTRYDSSGASRVNMPQQTWRCWENIKRI